MKKSNKSLGLSIRGLPSGSGQLNTIPLRVQAETATYIPHKTNWDFTSYQPAINNRDVSNNVTINLSDYSSNYYDYYYALNQGLNYQSYDIQSTWYINDIDMEDDIAVVATKDWTSTEKYVKNFPITSGAILHLGGYLNKIIYRASAKDGFGIYQATVNATNLASNQYGSVVILINSSEVSYGVQGGIVNGINLGCSNSSSPPTFVRYEGFAIGPLSTTITRVGEGCYTPCNPENYTGGDPATDVGDWVSDPREVTIRALEWNCSYYKGVYRGIPPTTPIGLCCNISGTRSITPINILSYGDLDAFYKASRYTLANNSWEASTGGNGEYYLREVKDFSDIAIEVTYTPNKTGIISNVQYAGLESGNHIKTYKFGGVYKNPDFSKYVTAYNTLDSNNKNKLIDTNGLQWFLVEETSEDCEVTSGPREPYSTSVMQEVNYSIYLSSYIVPTGLNSIVPINDAQNLNGDMGRYDKKFNFGSTNNLIFPYLLSSNVYSSGTPVGISNIKLTKYANFPTCGKVDIYTKKTGSVTSITDNTITSSGHGLEIGDSVKFTCGLNSSSGITNINGIRYVSGITTNTFKIYADPVFQTGIKVENLRSISGVTWTANGTSVWKYNNTLYSPQGKNGYGYTQSLRTTYETGVDSSNMFARAVESSGTDNGRTLPQAYFDGNRSWNNFYPFERMTADSIITMPNGNKFGSDCQISKVASDTYLLMVTEPGAEVSFKAFEEWSIVQNSTTVKPPPKPENQVVTPKYLPYGRVHFYKIKKNPYSISYLTSISASGNPWLLYELYNTNDIGYKNLPVTMDKLRNTYNTTFDDYWLGAIFYAWNKDYKLNSFYNTEIPYRSEDKDQNEFGWLDSFGKSAAFEVVNNKVYVATSTNVKGSLATRPRNLDQKTKTFVLDITNIGSNSITVAHTGEIVSQYSPNTSIFSTQSQTDEMPRYGNNIDMDRGKLFVGWPAQNRGRELLYIYNRDSTSGYTNPQTLISEGNKGYGDYLVVDNDILVTDKLSDMDDQDNITVSDLSYLYVYKRDFRSNQYIYSHRISPTVDLTDARYQHLTTDYYEATANLSYNNTTGDSATLKVNLYGKYDIYDESLVLRDYNEYAYFVYDGISKSYKIKNHSDASYNMTEFGTIRMRPSASSSFIGESTSQFIQPLDLLEGSDNVSYARIISTSYEYPNSLKLMLKTIEGISSGNITLNTRGLEYYRPQAPTGLFLYTQGPLPYATGMTLFFKMPELAKSGMTLMVKRPDLFASGTKLFIKDKQATSGITLHMNPVFKYRFPLFMKTFPLQTLDESGNVIGIEQLGYYSGVNTLFISNKHTGVPNSSGNTNLYLETYPYEDFGKMTNLVIGIDNEKSASGIELFINNPSGSSYTNMSLYLDGPDFLSGVPYGESANLFIKRVMDATMPLTVYNTVSSDAFNLFIRNADLYSSGINLYTSGLIYPEGFSNSGTLHTKGTVL